MLLDLGFLILLAILSAGVGLRVLDWLGATPEHPLDAWALASPLGLGALAMGVLGLAEVGWLTAGSVVGLLVVGAVAGGTRGGSGIASIFSLSRGEPTSRRAQRGPSASLSLRERAGVRVVARRAGPERADLRPTGDAGTFTPALSQREREQDGAASHAEKSVGSSEGRRIAEGPEIGPFGDRSTCHDPHPGPLPEGEGGRETPRSLPKDDPRGRRFLLGPGLLFDLPLMIALIGTLLTALAPVTDGDALCYHLQVPKIFLARHSAVFEPDLHETIYPLVTEALYAVGLATRGPVACRLIQWLLGVTFAANVGAMARPVLGDRARWASAVALLVPAVSNGMGAPLNDVALAAFGNAAVFAWTRWHDRPSARSAIVAGILAGLAIGVKYPALVLAGLLGLGFLARGKVRHALVFGVVAVGVGGGWYLRAFVHTGNPVYPFFRQVFGGSGIDEVLDPIKRPMAVTVGNLLTAIGPMTLEPDRFDSFSHQFGPAFLLFLPALLWMRPPRRVVGVVGLGYAFLVLCLTQRQSMRFVLIAVGPMAVGVAWLASSWWDRRSFPGRVLVGLLAACLAFESGLAVARARHGLGVVLGRESADSYLSRREPTFVVGRWVDANLPGDARLVGQDHRGFYLPRDYAMELAHRRRTGLGKAGESAPEVVEGLRRAGFTHVLLCPPVPEDAVEFDPTLGRLLEPWLTSRPPLYRRDLADADGVVRRYAIYGLESPIAEARR